MKNPEEWYNIWLKSLRENDDVNFMEFITEIQNEAIHEALEMAAENAMVKCEDIYSNGKIIKHELNSGSQTFSVDEESILAVESILMKGKEK